MKAGKGGKDGLAGWKAGRIGSCEAGEAMGWWAGGLIGLYAGRQHVARMLKVGSGWCWGRWTLQW